MGEAKRRREALLNGHAIDECPPTRHVLIAIPAYDGTVTSATASSLIETAPQLWAAGIEVSSSILPGCCYVDLARNKLVAAFLESDCTDLLFLDADVGFQPETALRVLLAPRPVVGAVYPKRADKLEFPVRIGSEGVHSTDEMGLLEVEFLPTGFLRINRAVFAAMNAPSFEDHGSRMKAYFRAGQEGGEYVGEDVRFCREWRALGGKIRMVPTAEMSHTGTKTWVANWGELSKARAAE